MTIIKSALERDEDVVVICSEHHRFTINYEAKKFLTTIIEVYMEGGTILLGNTKNFSNTIKVSENRWWIDSFNGSSFLVLYKDIFGKIMSAAQNHPINTEKLLSDCSLNKTLLYPFISNWNELSSNDFPKNNKRDKIVERDAGYRLNQLSEIEILLKGIHEIPN